MSKNPIPDSASTEDNEGDERKIGVAFIWSSLALLLIAAAVVVGVVYYNRPDEVAVTAASDQPTAEVREENKVELPKVTFKDITAEAGINFTHYNGATGQKLLPETMGGGCAFLDYDKDGDQDLVFVNSCPWPGDKAPDKMPTMALYRNGGTGQFEDVTEAAGLAVSFYGQGVTCADYDGDGWSDLYITAVGPNHLFKNVEGVFKEVTTQANVAGLDTAWSTGAAWLDVDQDQDLDLFVCNYVKWSKEIDLGQDFQLVGVGRAYGPPLAFEGSYPFLFRNEGNGTFTDISEESGVQVKNAYNGEPAAKSLGVCVVDLEQDGLPDIVVANDTVQNFVFHNQGKGKFVEKALEMGVAFDSTGVSRGGMGASSSYFRNNNDLAISIGNFANEMTAFYVSQGDPLNYTDDAIATGLGPPTRLELTFGLFFFDYDLDGRTDLLSNNGHLEVEINRVQESQQYAQSPHLFWNAGPNNPSEFVSVPEDSCGADLVAPLVGRGSAYADIDGDMDLDVVLTQTGGPPRLLRNDQSLGNHKLRIHLKGKFPNTDAIGSLVEVDTDQGTQRCLLAPTQSYLSQSEMPLTFGLGSQAKVKTIRVKWPDGSKSEAHDIAADQVLELLQVPATGGE